MPFLRQRPETFRQQSDAFSFEGQFLCFGAKEMARYADYVTDVKRLEQSISFFAETIFARVDLQPASTILKVKERSLAELTYAHDAPGQDDIRCNAREIFLAALVELGYDFRCGVIGSKVIGVDFMTGFPEFCELLPAHFNLLAGLFYKFFFGRRHRCL